MMTTNKKSELERLKWFSPHIFKKITEKDIKAYFDSSERGIGDGGKIGMAKSRQGIILTEYEKGILDRTTPYFTILGGEESKEFPPRDIVDFLKKELFKGIDADFIENMYQEVIKIKKNSHG